MGILNKMKRGSIKIFLLFSSLLLSYHIQADEEKEELRRELRFKHLLPIDSQKLTDDEMREYYNPDYKKVQELNLRLFYSLGKIYGYAVFIDEKNDFAVVEGSTLKIVLKHPSFISGSKIIHIPVEASDFRKLTLRRGDTIVALEIPRIRYGERLPKKTTILVKAEFFQLTDHSSIYIY